MIQRGHRDKAAQLLRAFLRHELTGAQVDDQWPRGSDDPAVSEIHFHLVFDGVDSIEMLCETEHSEIIPIIESCVRFLDSDLPYRWPKSFTYRSILSGCFVSTLFVLGPGALVVWMLAAVVPMPDSLRPYIAIGSGMIWMLLAAVVIVPRFLEWRSRKNRAPDWPFHDTQIQENANTT